MDDFFCGLEPPRKISPPVLTCLEEIGACAARAERHDGDPIRSQFLRQSEREARHERLGRSIRGRVGDGLETRGGGDVDNRAVALRDHRWQQPVCELHGGVDIQVQHLALAVEWKLPELPTRAKAGVVHEQVDFVAALAEGTRKLISRAGSAQVKRQGLG